MKMKNKLLILAVICFTALLAALPVSADNITQTSAGYRSAAFTWRDPQLDISMPITVKKYKVAWGKDPSSLTKSKTVSGTTRKAVIKDLNSYSRYYVKVSFDYTVKSSGRTYSGYYGGYVRTRPGKPRKAKVSYGPEQKSLKLSFLAPTGNSSGALYQYEIVTINGKVLKKGKGLQKRLLSYENLPVTSVTRFTVRAYQKIGKTTYYSDYLTKYLTPQPVFDPSKCSIKNGKMGLVWSHVTGATGYDVFVSLTREGGYSKVASYGPGALSAVITSFNGSPFKANTKYYVRIQTRSKYGKSAKTYGILLRHILY